jgi:type IX secretion system PorP/SprF family membrane protein
MKKQFLLFLVSIFLFSSFTKVLAQDYQFSQFYANILYLNPAFAGSTHKTRAIFHQRLQWPSLDAQYTTSVLSLDHYFNKANSGIGVIFTKDQQGASNISSTDISLMYSYELHISSKYSFRAGLQAGYVSRYINYSVLSFPDQYSVNGKISQTTNEPFGNDKRNYLDLSSGGVFYSDKFWFSAAYNHMNTPNQSFYGYGSQSNLPAKFSFTSGYKFALGGRSVYKSSSEKTANYLVPTAHYKSQGKSDQLDLGLYGIFGQFMAGFWYRGIPIKNYSSRDINNESVVVLCGYKFKPVSIGYSYDFTVSKLTKARTGGAHELNITIVFGKPIKKKKTIRKIPCPDFD